MNNELMICQCKKCERQNACDCKTVKCEVCDVEVLDCNTRTYKTIKFCPTCLEKEKVAEIELKAGEAERVAAVSANIDVKEQYFTAENTDLALIEGTPFERALKIKERIDDWSKKLFEVQTRRNTAQQYYIDLTKNLRQEERIKLGLPADYLSYQVKQIAPKRDKMTQRMSKEDRTLFNMAGMLYGKKLAALDTVNKECFQEHPEWWFNGVVKKEHEEQYNDYVIAHGAMTEKIAVQRVKDGVKSSRAINFQQLASGERKLSD